MKEFHRYQNRRPDPSRLPDRAIIKVEKLKSSRKDESENRAEEKEEECYWQSYRELTVVGDSQHYGEEVWLAQVVHKRSKRKRVKVLVSYFFWEFRISL